MLAWEVSTSSSLDYAVKNALKFPLVVLKYLKIKRNLHIAFSFSWGNAVNNQISLEIKFSIKLKLFSLLLYIYIYKRSTKKLKIKSHILERNISYWIKINYQALSTEISAWYKTHFSHYFNIDLFYMLLVWESTKLHIYWASLLKIW